MNGADGGTKAIYFDCFSGISGDMTLGALVDCGADPESLRQILKGLELNDYQLCVEKVSRYGLSGTDVEVKLTENHTSTHRRFSDIAKLIRDSVLPDQVKENSVAVFENLAGAEAAVHNIPVERVHFHEVGAVDAIVDIVGSVTALYLLGIEKVYCSPLPVGRGMVKSVHGLLPLPAPATMELCKRRQTPLYGKDTEMELVTPTGAAIVTTLASSFGPPPALTVEAVGYGAGKLDPGYANYLRVIVGKEEILPTGIFEERVQVIEAAIDDLNPEIYGYLMEKLFAEGALDVYFTPIQMKKNRPAVKLTVLAPSPRLTLLSETIFSETSTLGLRVLEARKIMKPREMVTIDTDWGPVRVKIVPQSDGAIPLHFAPEHDDCAAIAGRTGVPLKEIYREVEYCFRKLYRHNR